ncbi:MAG: hypothetical protein U0271_04520 [Polyangiaceae bacterium]
MARWSGWIAVALMVAAALVPLFVRVRDGRRANLESRPVATHVIVGMTAAGLGFLHPLTALFALGSPGAIGGGVLGLALGGLAFVVLLSHSGIGLKLRDPKLKRRSESRSRHLVTATLVTTLALAHAVACIVGRSR